MIVTRRKRPRPAWRHAQTLQGWTLAAAAFSFVLQFSGAWAGEPLPVHVEHPFRHLAAWLREVDPDLRAAEPKALSRAITVLSKSQKTFKSFDGVAHELGGRIAGDPSTSDIEKIRAEASLQKDRAKARTARRLLWKLTNVELALNAAEAAEAAAQADPDVSERYFAEAGLLPLPEPRPPSPPANSTAGEGAAAIEEGAAGAAAAASATPAVDGGNARAPRDPSSPAETVGSVTERTSAAEEKPQIEEERPLQLVPTARFSILGGEVRCHAKLDPAGMRLVLAFGDSLEGGDQVRALAAPPLELRLAAHGLVSETVYVNGHAYRAACRLLGELGGAIAGFLGDAAYKDYFIFCTGHSFAGAVAAVTAGILDGVLNVRESPPPRPSRKRPAASASAGSGSGSRGVGARRKEAGVAAAAAPQRKRAARSLPEEEGFSGSAGSSQATPETHKAPERAPAGLAPAETPEAATGSSAAADGTESPTRGGWRRCAGSAKARVSCVALGCPPCLSRNVALPFVTSFILGDDVIPRLSERSLRQLQSRLVQVLPRGRGIFSQGLAVGASLFSDAASVAMQGVRQYSTAGEDDVTLSLPGCVWFVKPRRLHGGATMTRVMRGNLREDILWQVHDVLLSKSMLSHHRLGYYVTALDRV